MKTQKTRKMEYIQKMKDGTIMKSKITLPIYIKFKNII
jgi:hypothetical protein